MDAIKWAFISSVSVVLFVLALTAVPFHVVYRTVSKKYDLSYYFRQIAVGNDVMVGSMVYGSRHTVSAITGYRAYNGDRWHMVQERVIDFFVGKRHCFNEAVDEKLIEVPDTRYYQTT